MALAAREWRCGVSIDPKHYVDIDDSELVNLNRKLAQVLCAIAETVMGEDFSTIIGGGDTAAHRQRGFKEFVRDADAYMNHQNKRTRGQVRTGLRTIESPFLRRFLIKAGDGAFSWMDLRERQDLFAKLQAGDTENQGKFYTGFTNLVVSFFYGHENAWCEIQYDGPSVRDQRVLDGHRWRQGGPDTVPCTEPPSGCDGT